MSRKKASTHMILENRTLLTMKSRMSTNSSNDDDVAQNRGNLKKRRGQNDSKDFSQTSILDPEAPIDVSSLSPILLFLHSPHLIHKYSVRSVRRPFRI